MQVRPVFQRQSTSTARRRGAAAVEAALVLPVFLTFLFAMLDLSLAVARYNSLSECARRAARAAIVRGERSTSPLIPLGPATWTGTAAENHPLVEEVRPLLVTMPPAQVAVRCEWPDGGHRFGQRVRVELRYEHPTLFTALFGNQPWTLSATSTMRIVH
jgi:hypothetical protein